VDQIYLLDHKDIDHLYKSNKTIYSNAYIGMDHKLILQANEGIDLNIGFKARLNAILKQK